MAEINWDAVKGKVQSFGIFIYFIVGIIIAGTVSYVLYTRFNKQVAAILVFMAMVMALYYYYVKWFVIGDDFQPPKTNCPDLMSAVAMNGMQYVCANSMGAYSGMSGTIADTVKTMTLTEAEKKTGIVSAIGAGGYVLTPDPGKADTESYKTYCNNLKSKGITHLSLCKYRPGA